MPRSLLSLILFTILISCSSDQDKQTQLSEEDIKKASELILDANKAQVRQEKAEINEYIKRRKLDVDSTGTGLKYKIIKSSNGKEVKSEMLATIDYRVELLDGTLIYSSETTGPKTFVVDHDNIESGIHEGVKLLREGEHAIFILPSHLAFGLTGDHDKVPPASPLVYSIELKQVK